MIRVLFSLLIFAWPLAAGATNDSLCLVKIVKAGELADELVPWVEKINGVDRKYFSGRSLLIPRDTVVAASYCPLEKFQADYQQFDSLIVVYLEKNLLAVYQQGWLWFWAPITRGRRVSSTPQDTFFVKNKWRLIYSKKYGNVPMPYALHITGNVCIHQGPMVGRGASHGCIRLFKRHAVWLYQWATVGTRVIIL